MANLAALRTALAGALTGVPTTTGVLTAYAEYPRTFAFPAVFIDAAAKTSVEDFDGSRRYVFDLHVYTQVDAETFGQDEIMPLLSDQITGGSYGAIEDAIDADPTLGGVCDYAVMGSSLHNPDLVWSKPGGVVKQTIGGVQVFGWTLQLEMLVSGARAQ